MLELLIAGAGYVLSAIFEFLVGLLPGSPDAKRRRAVRRRVRSLARAGDWDAIEQEFQRAMEAGFASRLPSTVLDALPNGAAPHVATMVARGLRVGDPLTLMPAARIAPHTHSDDVYFELTVLRDSGDRRLNAIADYALRRWPEPKPATGVA